ncbi:ATP-binding cassette domain-containing protein [Paraburkholderia sp. RP-4-7]|uniref:ATP-binding cassette domain-containing protein n=2 Tax=Paraburkholderia polaris TaxID=2728848 RepID=A0A848IDT4_9BURK|nr:ATP-binding cassette domain-containing protein [Paraburkholderia polaris]
MNLHVDAVHLPGGLVASDQPGAQLWKWSLANCHARQPEMSSVSDVDYSPRIAVSTFVDFAAVGKAYLERAAPMARITPAIQALADKLTRDVEDRRQQAEILYNWISTHVRYVAVHLGIGSVVPHSADAVLTAVYGDCKDHVTLFEALLAAKGIKSAPVLVNSNSIYWLPEVALPVGVFDHAITYLPEFAMFVDSTDGEPAVLGGVSLSIAPGESVALVGPPGCGKTTLVGDIGDAADAGTRWSTNCGAS